MTSPASQPPVDEQLSLLLLLVAAHQRLGRVVEQELAAEGVVAPDYALLSVIGARGPLTLTDAAVALGSRLTTASDAVRRLERRGHVERKPNPSDGRSTLLVLSPDGDRLWRRGWPALRRIDANIAERVTDPAASRLALIELGRALDAAIDERPGG